MMETSVVLSAVLLISILGFIATKGTLPTAIGETVWEETDLTSTDDHGVLATEMSVATEPTADVITPDNLHSTTIPAITTEVINATEIRLVNGTHPSEGRLEIKIIGVWGTICDDSFDVYDALVACSMLGYTGITPQVKSSAYFGPGGGPIFLDSMACMGNETNILECQHSPIGVHDCSHSEDVGIVCRDATEIRLVNGTHPSEGRLEIHMNGVWGTICDDNFDVYDALVACSMLGYTGITPQVKSSAYFGPGGGPIFLDSMACMGNETNILECQHSPIGVHDCSHSEDVGIVCRDATEIRLVNGTHPSEGRLEIHMNGVWGTICDDNFDVYDALVACSMLGYTGITPQVKSSAYFGPGGGPIFLDSMACMGNETNILECQHSPIGVHDCSHSEDVGIVCRDATEIRLVNGTHPSEGRLEIHMNGVWGTICDDNFDVYDALVACSMLGYTGITPQVKSSAYFGPGGGPIFLDSMACMGNETNILECQHSPIGVHDCSHSEDVGIVCRDVPALRLVNGSTFGEGRVEININGTWGTVCDDGFDVNDATVVCRILGITGVTPQVRDAAYFGIGTGPIYLDDMGCSGTETDLILCPHPPVGVHNCGHNEDVGVVCRPLTTTTPGPTMSRVRLVNGTHVSDGRLEIFVNGGWGTICDDSFDVSDATVACRMLGYTGVTPEVRGLAFYGPGIGQILLDDLACTGSETDLLACQHPLIGVHNCGHNEDVGISCRPEPPRSRVRLVNGTHLSDGRLEILINGGWGTICDDSFDISDAIVACRMLGITGVTPEVRGSAFYGPGTGQILLDDVECSGSETDLLACQHPQIGVHNCGHNEDVGIICRPEPPRSRVRLVNGTLFSDGRLEILINGDWGTVCDDYFDVSDAIVACRMLGLSGVTPEVRGSAFYGPGSGQILLDDLACTGNETDLLACQHPPIGVHNCGHNEDVGIICRQVYY